AGFQRDLVLAILECLGNFIEHSISFLFFTDRFSGAVAHLAMDDRTCKPQTPKCPHQPPDAGISAIQSGYAGNYLRRPSFSIKARYRLASLSFRYARRLLRRLTILIK